MPPSDLTAPVGAAVGSGVELPTPTPNRATATPHHLTATRGPASAHGKLCSPPSAVKAIVAVPQPDLRHAHAEHHQQPERPLHSDAAMLDTLHPLDDQGLSPRLPAYDADLLHRDEPSEPGRLPLRGFIIKIIIQYRQACASARRRRARSLLLLIKIHAATSSRAIWLFLTRAGSLSKFDRWSLLAPKGVS